VPRLMRQRQSGTGPFQLAPVPDVGGVNRPDVMIERHHSGRAQPLGRRKRSNRRRFRCPAPTGRAGRVGLAMRFDVAPGLESGVLPHPPSRFFFQQTIFEGQLSHDLLQRAGLASQLLPRPRSRPAPYRQPVASSRSRESLSTTGNRGSGRSPRGGRARRGCPCRADLPVQCGSCLPLRSVAASRGGSSSPLTDFCLIFAPRCAVPECRGISHADATFWPASGSEDTELGVLMELEVGHGETEVYPRVQA
jgi:hypothetical protein